MELFLENGAPVEASDKNTLLHLAAKSSQPDIVELLILKGASIEALNHNNQGLTVRGNSILLHCAAQNGHIGLMKLLLRQGSSLEAMGGNNMNKNSQTPGQLVRAHSHPRVCDV